MSKIKLEPCPLCGGRPVIYQFVEDADLGGWNIMCSNPYCTADTTRCDTLEEAVEVWDLQLF